jgi:low temperature requirement protein LtrA
VEAEQKVTPLELFFDLVFVFAITQVTAMMAKDPTWPGVGRGLMILAAIWWAWVGYSWLTNFLATDEGVIRGAIFTAMAAMLVLAVALPHAFDDDAVLFAAAYAIVRVTQLAIYWISSKGDEGVRRSLTTVGPTWLIGPALILIGGLVGGDARYVLWGLALLIDFSGPLLSGIEGWHLHPGHFAERHGLIIIIAIGESIVAIGIGASEFEAGLTVGVIASIVLGVAVSCAMWWAYFDVVAIVAERKLHGLAAGGPRNRQARDSYSYLHLPMIAGIVLFALGAKKTVADYDHALKLVPAVALSGGIALYLLAHVLFRLRNLRTLNHARVVATVVLLAFIPLATELDAIVALAVVTVITVSLVTYERITRAAARDRVRHPQEVHA